MPTEASLSAPDLEPSLCRSRPALGMPFASAISPASCWLLPLLLLEFSSLLPDWMLPPNSAAPPGWFMPASRAR